MSAYAEACAAGVADDVHRLLFTMFWEKGAHIGHPNVLRTPLAGRILRGITSADPLRESGDAVSFNRGPTTAGAHQRIGSCRHQLVETRLATALSVTR